MAITPIKVLLFLAGGTAAAGATAYVAGVFDPYLGTAPPVVASEPASPPQVAAIPPSEPPAAAAPAPATEPPAAAAPPAAQAPAGEPPAAAVEPPAVGAPADPATPPAAEASAVQPPTFVLVRAEADGSLVVAGRAAPNAKVEIVLGSRIIGASAAGPEGDFAIVLDEPLKPGDYQLVLRSTTPDNVVAMSQETAVVSIPETPDGQVLALVEQPGQAAKLITVPVAPVPEAPAEAAPPATAAAPVETAPEAPPATAGQDVAATEPQPVPSEVAPAPAPAAAAKIAVEAVEIEGRKIFVAGVADPGALVRGYANEILLGETTVSPGGRFLIEAERDLAVGDYIIRVDVIGADGVKVVARAAVPFEREPGENLAAVAPPAGAPATEPTEPTAPPSAAEAPAAEPAAGTETAPAPPAVAEAPVAEPAPPAAAAAPAVEPAPPPAPEAVAQAPAPAAPPAVAEAPAAAPVPVPEPAPPAVAAAPPVEPAPPELSDGPAPAPGAEAPADVAAAPAAVEPAPAEVLAPKLQAVDGAVIIRRGDTLWRISKRVYGRGVRYSTIYLANQEQIRDPDRIWPGQIFSVPDTSKEGEPADMQELGEQAVKVVPYNG